MTKYTPNPLASLTNEQSAISTINQNLEDISNALENMLSRDGTSPNEMEATFDMNGNRIINLPNPATETEPLRLRDLADFLGVGTISTMPSGGTAGQVLTKDTATDYDVSWQTPKPGDVYFVSNYLSEASPLQAACDAALADVGGTVVVDAALNLTGAIGLNLDGCLKPLRITGANQQNGGAAWGNPLFYLGSGVAISAVNAVSVEIDHIYLSANQPTITLCDFTGAVYSQIHDCALLATNSAVGNVGIKVGDTQGMIVERNTIAIQGGRGILGVTVSFSVKCEIRNNTFVNSYICISSPGQAWRVVGNIAQNPGLCFLEEGPAGTCDTLYLNGNDIDDGTGAKTWVNSNAGCLISINNRYTNSGTCISQVNSTGSVISIGDRLQGTVGVAIGTGNYLAIINYDQGHIPTSLYTGTPANTNVVKVIGGAADITGQLSLGLSGSYSGSLRVWHTTGGANSVTITPPVAAPGAVTLTWPATSGAILSTTNNVTVTSKVFDNTNIYTTRDDRFTLQDSADTTKQAVFELSGITTGTTRTYTLPNASGTLLYSGGPLGTPSSGVVTNLTGTASININGTVGATTPATGAFTTVDAPTIRAAGTLTNINGTTGSETVTLLLAGGSGANGGSYLQFAKNTGANVSHYFGHESAIFGGGSTSYSMVLYNAGLSGGLAGRIFTASNTDNSVLFTSSVKSSSSSAGIGYATGAGNTATQATNKSTGVTLNYITGQITMNAAALASGGRVGFTFTNSTIAATDVVIVNIKNGGSGATVDAYTTQVDAVSAGSCRISLYNGSVGSLSEAVVLQYAVIKGSNS